MRAAVGAGLHHRLPHLRPGSGAARAARSRRRCGSLPQLEAAGVTLINTGIGWHEARIPTIAGMVPRAAFAWVTARLKTGTRLPGDCHQPHQRSRRRREPAAATARRTSCRWHGRCSPIRSSPNKAAHGPRRRDQHLHCLQPGLPRPHLRGQACDLPRESARRRARPSWCCVLCRRQARVRRRRGARGAGVRGRRPPSAAIASRCSSRMRRSAGSSVSHVKCRARKNFTRRCATSASPARRLGVDVRLGTRGDHLDSSSTATSMTSCSRRRTRRAFPEFPASSIRKSSAIRTCSAASARPAHASPSWAPAASASMSRRSSPRIAAPIAKPPRASTVRSGASTWTCARRAVCCRSRSRRPPAGRSTCCSGKTRGPARRSGSTTGWTHRTALLAHGVEMRSGVAYERIDDRGLHISTSERTRGARRGFHRDLCGTGIATELAEGLAFRAARARNWRRSAAPRSSMPSGPSAKARSSPRNSRLLDRSHRRMFDELAAQLPLWSDRDATDGWSLRESRRARRLTVRVFHSGRVEVVVPARTSQRTVERFIERHRPWIERKRAEARRNAVRRRALSAGVDRARWHRRDLAPARRAAARDGRASRPWRPDCCSSSGDRATRRAVLRGSADVAAEARRRRCSRRRWKRARARWV